MCTTKTCPSSWRWIRLDGSSHPYAAGHPEEERPSPAARVGRCLGMAALVLVTLLAAPAMGQTLFKSVTPDGQIVYSDRPPQQARVVKELSVDIVPATAGAAENIVLYTASGCRYCAEAKRYLNSRAIVYREINVATPSGRRAFNAARDGYGGVPLLVTGDKRLRGFSRSTYDAFFEKAPKPDSVDQAGKEEKSIRQAGRSTTH